MAPADVRKHTVASLVNVPLMKEHHGRDFYKYFFTTHPEHRRYYKGAENFNADDVEKSERFDKLGHAILLHVHVLANTFDNEFWGYWKGFLESKGTTLSAEQKEAWDTLGKLFNEEAQSQLTKHGRPHV
ncbi:globin [Ancylostoma duodenale]|uniref:Globin n=1 Tax=Ancylostoma duodenale TaxID=51022 RepID=A0A0C2GLK2_9BILA|nr:globin [Ancylostoma duodenale]